MNNEDINITDKYIDILQINKKIILKKDLKKIAKEQNITKKTLLKMLKEQSYEYDKKSKGYIDTKSNTNPLKIDTMSLESAIENFISIQQQINENTTKKYDEIIEDKSVIKSNTDLARAENTRLESAIEKLMYMQFEFNKNITEHYCKLAETIEQLAENKETNNKNENIIDAEVSLVADKNWTHTPSNLKADENTLKEYDRICKERLKNLKKQEVTTIMIKQFIQQYQ